jgi:hypothetical protein
MRIKPPANKPRTACHINIDIRSEKYGRKSFHILFSHTPGKIKGKTVNIRARAYKC